MLADAPIQHWLSLRSNPQVANMTQEQLAALIQKLKSYAASPPTLSAKLADDSEKIKIKRTTVASKTKAILDGI